MGQRYSSSHILKFQFPQGHFHSAMSHSKIWASRLATHEHLDKWILFEDYDYKHILKPVLRKLKETSSIAVQDSSIGDPVTQCSEWVSQWLTIDFSVFCRAVVDTFVISEKTKTKTLCHLVTTSWLYLTNWETPTLTLRVSDWHHSQFLRCFNLVLSRPIIFLYTWWKYPRFQCPFYCPCRGNNIVLNSTRIATNLTNVHINHLKF